MHAAHGAAIDSSLAVAGVREGCSNSAKKQCTAQSASRVVRAAAQHLQGLAAASQQVSLGAVVNCDKQQ